MILKNRFRLNLSIQTVKKKVIYLDLSIRMLEKIVYFFSMILYGGSVILKKMSEILKIALLSFKEKKYR